MNIAAPNRAKRPRGADRRSIADSASLADAVVPTGVFGPLGILFERRTRRGLFATFLISLLVYGLTCARTLTGEDCGEFVSAAYTFGVAHPPGYPLWTMLAKLFTVLVPFGEIAFRVAFMSAFFGALTTTALAASSLLLVRSWPAALAAAFGFAFLRDQWSQATIVEVYTLNSSFLSTCVLLLLAWSKIKSPRLLTAFAFTFGLSLTNHQTMLALAPGAFFFILFHHRRFLLEGRLLLSCVGAAVLGLLPYAYLPIAARRHPASNWGDPSDWTRFVDHVLRRQYTGGGDPPPKETWSRFLAQLDCRREHLVAQGGAWLIVFGLVAFVFAAFLRRDLLYLFLPTALLSTVGIILYTNFKLDFENIYTNRLFFVPAYLVLILSAAWSLGSVIEAFTGRPRRFMGAACQTTPHDRAEATPSLTTGIAAG